MNLIKKQNHYKISEELFDKLMENGDEYFHQNHPFLYMIAKQKCVLPSDINQLRYETNECRSKLLQLYEIVLSYVIQNY